MNVLSLFDGISCGQVALERAGIVVDNYYACEIDKYAIQVTQKNYPNTIQLGDVTKVDFSQLKDIDLVIGGSPCQGFSFAGKQLNFNDERSKLFFEFVRALKEIKPKYFLLENVVMKQEYQNVISEYLGVNPILINSSFVSAQNRKRLYWTNIPNVEQPYNKKNQILLGDIKLNSNIDEKFYLSEKALSGILNSTYTQQRNCIVYQNEKCKTLRARDYKGAKVIQDQDLRYRYLTPIEYERLQTLPDNYTDCVSDTQRYKALGNGWTVDVIAHIFRGLNG